MDAFHQSSVHSADRRMIFYAPGGTSSREPGVAARHASLTYGLDLMTSAARDTVTEDGSSGSSGDEHIWNAYSSTQFRRFKAYGVADEMFDSMMAGIVSDSSVEFNGYAYSLGSTLVNNGGAPEEDMARLARIGAMNKPSIALWGTADTDVPYRNHETLLRYVPHCVLRTFEDESHMFFQVGPQLQTTAPFTKNKFRLHYIYSQVRMAKNTSGCPQLHKRPFRNLITKEFSDRLCVHVRRGSSCLGSPASSRISCCEAQDTIAGDRPWSNLPPPNGGRMACACSCVCRQRTA